MATIKDYYDDLIQIKEGKSELSELQPYNENGAQLMDDLNSGSKTALWRLFFWIVAALAWMLNQALDKHKIEVQNNISNQSHGNLRHYGFRALNFQFGHSLEYNGKQYVYLNEDPAAKIIKRCATGMNQGVMRFKVTKESGGILEPLTITEQNAFKDFLRDVLYPGTNYEVISSAADLLKLSAKFFVNPQVINQAGEHVVTGEPVIENAINDFVKNLPFNGRMNIQQLIDHIQKVEGVEDIRLLESAYKYGSLAWIVFTREIEPFSGYMELDLNNSNLEYHEYV